MMKINKKILASIISITIILAIVYNANNFLVFYYNSIWNISYLNWNYWLASIYHKKALDKKNDEKIFFNLWSDYYKLWIYDKSLKAYLNIDLSSWSDISFNTYYNLWNIFYKLWDLEKKDLIAKINLWQKSLLSYKQVLLNKEDKKTRQNYIFVSEKLSEVINELKKEQEKLSEEVNKIRDKANVENKSSEKWEDKKEANNDDEKKETDSSIQNQSSASYRWEEYQIWSSKIIEKISIEEMDIFDNYNEWLKNEQKNNSIFFKKENRVNNKNNDVLNNIYQDPFFNSISNFDDSILEKNIKDW